ncbi:MAG TPA: hypothetical protein VID73_00475 [Ktedonobacterales bacterium]
MAASVSEAVVISERRTATGTAATWRRRGLIAGLSAAYIAAAGLIGLFPIDSTDLDAFFFPSARIAVMGHPLLVYSLHYQEIYPNANGPLSLVPLTAVAALAQHLGWLDALSLRRMLVMAAFSVFTLLLAWEAVAAIDRLRGRPLAGVARLFAYAVFTVTPDLWHGFWLYGHIEQPLTLWLLLLGLRLLAEGRVSWAGVALGLTVLGRSSSVVYLIAVLAVLLARRRWLATLVCLLAAAATVGLGLLPFLLGDRGGTTFSLFTFRGALGVSGGSLLGLTIGTPLEAFAQSHDSTLVVAGAAVVAGTLALARRDLTPAARNLYPLVALAALCFPLFIKTVWPYYFADVFVLLAVWWLGTRESWESVRHWLGALVPVFATVCSMFAEYGAGLYNTEFQDPTDIKRESLVMALLLLVFLIGVAARLLLGPPEPEPVGARSPLAPAIAGATPV